MLGPRLLSEGSGWSVSEGEKFQYALNKRAEYPPLPRNMMGGGGTHLTGVTWQSIVIMTHGPRRTREGERKGGSVFKREVQGSEYKYPQEPSGHSSLTTGSCLRRPRTRHRRRTAGSKLDSSDMQYDPERYLCLHGTARICARSAG